MPLTLQLILIFLLGSLYVTGYSWAYINFPIFAALNVGLLAWAYELSLDYKESQRKSRYNIPVLSNGYLPKNSLVDMAYIALREKRDGLGLIDWARKKYGHFFQARIVFTQFYVVSDPEIIQKLFNSNNPKHLNKNRLFYDKIFISHMNEGLIASEYHIWSPHRKIASRAFTYKSLQSYLGIMNRYSKKFVEDIKGKCGVSGKIEGKEIDDTKYFYLMKIITNIVMNADVCSEEEYETLYKKFNLLKEIVVWRTINPLIMVCEPIWWLHPKRRIVNDCIRELTRIVYEAMRILKEKRDEEKAKGVQWIDPQDGDVGLKPFRCLLEELLHAGMSDKEIFDEVITSLVAGHETTAVSVGTLWWHLALNPEYQKKCREEVDSIFDRKGVSDDMVELTMDDISDLKYLERCICENLRLTPTIPVFVRRLDAPLKIGDGPDDFEMEPGSNVVVVPWNVHRNTKYYPEPLIFNPDNFLPEKVKERHQYSFIPFSGGSRNCIGWKLSIQESKAFAAWTLRNFEISTTDKFEDVKFHFEVSIVPEKNINLIFKKRSS